MEKLNYKYGGDIYGIYGHLKKFGKNVSQKTSDMVEVTKLNSLFHRKGKD